MRHVEKRHKLIVGEGRTDVAQGCFMRDCLLGASVDWTPAAAHFEVESLDWPGSRESRHMRKAAAVGNAQRFSLSNPALCLCHRARELQLRRSNLGLMDDAVLASGSRRRWLGLYVGGM